MAKVFDKATGSSELGSYIKKQLLAFRKALLDKAKKDLAQEKFNGKPMKIEDLDKRQWDGTDGKDIKDDPKQTETPKPLETPKPSPAAPPAPKCTRR